MEVQTRKKSKQLGICAKYWRGKSAVSLNLCASEEVWLSTVRRSAHSEGGACAAAAARGAQRPVRGGGAPGAAHQLQLQHEHAALPR